MKKSIKFLAGAGAALSVFGLNKSIEVTDFTVTSKNLPPEFDGFKIAHISDAHSRPAEGVAEKISELRPNIIVITGDMLHDDNKSVDEIRALIESLLCIAPVYMITGNHDMWRCDHAKILAEFCDMGAVLLDGKLKRFRRCGAEIALFGVGDPFSHVPDSLTKKTTVAISKLPPFDGYKILLFHRANLFDILKNYGFDLILSGHMHGGQIQVPLLGGLLAPSSAIPGNGRVIFPKYCNGLFTYKNTTMIVNRGLCNTIPVIPRLYNRPEICAVTLHSSQKTAE